MGSTERRLVELSRSRDVVAFTLFSAAAERLCEEEWAELYAQEKQLASRRPSRNKDYFLGHTGFPSTSGESNRVEEHLAIAIYNSHAESGRGMVLPTGDVLTILDYQLPLKARRADESVGKVDLFGATSEGRACVVELKVGGRRYPDTPLRGLLEGLAYAAVVEANLRAITEEAQDKFGVTLSQTAPEVILAAPSDYWNAFRGMVDDAAWSNHMLNLASVVQQHTGVEVLFLDLLDASCEQGTSTVRPTLHRQLACRLALGGGPDN